MNLYVFKYAHTGRYATLSGNSVPNRLGAAHFVTQEAALGAMSPNVTVDLVRVVYDEFTNEVRQEVVL